MARSSFISHTVNGYSRYDLPESKAFTCTPGILYPVRIDFINARDRVTISQGIDVRSNPLAVPSFNPYTVRLHRFWVPLQLYHPEMRTNSSKFDMNDLTFNWFPATKDTEETSFGFYAFSNSLLSWLRISNSYLGTLDTVSDYGAVSLPSSAKRWDYVNADTYLAYWDIVRNYYGYSQWSLYSYAWPASWYMYYGSASFRFGYAADKQFFTQRYGNLEFLDAFFESQFYPSSVASSNGTFNRSNLFFQIVSSDLISTGAISGDGFPVSTNLPSSSSSPRPSSGNVPISQFDTSGTAASSTSATYLSFFLQAHPMAVVPSSPDRFSRLLPTTVASDSVKMSGITTIPQLAIASRLQEYKDLLGAGGSRYSDWLETFFASKIEHVDRPKLLFSASQTVNVQVVVAQSGANNFSVPGLALGQQGGAIAFNCQLGRSQSYYFREPGYMIDMLSIRPVYYWAGILPDYLGYQGADYFNPVYNDIGYQFVANGQLNPTGLVSGRSASYFTEPCFNEFRASYDEVLGQLQPWSSGGDTGLPALYSYWVQQRIFGTNADSGVQVFQQAPLLFVDMGQVNSPFASNVEDNFFVNLSYSVRKKSLVNKTFATRLSNR